MSRSRRNRGGLSNRNSKNRRRILLKIAERDGWICQICGKPIDPELLGVVNNLEAPSIDHRIPKFQGGTNLQTNLQVAHRRCNSTEYEQTAVA